MARRSARDSVVQAAANLIADRGFNAVSMGDIASAAGLHPTSIYRIFKERDELFEAVLTYALRHTEALRAEVFATDAPPAEKIKITTENYIINTREGRLDRRLLFRALADHDLATLKKIRDHRLSGINEFVDLISMVISGPESPWLTYISISTLAAGTIYFQPFHDLLHRDTSTTADLANRVLSMTIPHIQWERVGRPAPG